MKDIDILLQFINFYNIKYNEENIKIIKAIISDDNYQDLLWSFMKLKNDMDTIRKQYDYNIISLGDRCIPQTISVRCGLKLPRYISKEPMLFFDYAITNMKTNADILKHDIDNISLCDFINNENRYVSRKYGLIYEHDRYNILNKDIQEFDMILKERLRRLINILYHGNCLCVVCIYDTDKNKAMRQHLDALQDIIVHCNPTNRLFIIDNRGFLKDEYCHNDNYCLSLLPYKEYRWWIPDDFITEIGLKFMKNIAIKMSNYIINNFHISKNNIDFYSESSSDYNDFLASCSK